MIRACRISIEIAPSESRRCVAPRIACMCLCAPIFEQLHHVLVIEFSWMKLREIFFDVSQSEANAVSFRERIDSIKISDPTIGGKLGQASGTDRQRASRNFFPGLRQMPI